MRDRQRGQTSAEYVAVAVVALLIAILALVVGVVSAIIGAAVSFGEDAIELVEGLLP